MLRAALLLPLVLAAAPAAAQERVSFAAADGHQLHGIYLHPEGVPRGGVLLLHMYQSSSLAWEPITERLAARGYHVLALDMRGHGKSEKGPDGKEIDIGREATEDPASNPFLKMHLDAKAGLDLLVEKGAPEDRLAIVGASVGCSVALHCALKYPDLVAALVLMTPGSAYLGVPSLRPRARAFDPSRCSSSPRKRRPTEAPGLWRRSSARITPSCASSRARGFTARGCSAACRRSRRRSSSGSIAPWCARWCSRSRWRRRSCWTESSARSKAPPAPGSRCP